MVNEILNQETKRKNKIVAYWFLIGVFMIIVQTLLGGITRLSGSGLSITEWNVVTGAIPPLSENAWIAEFTKYKSSPQFQYLNSDFTLSDFKFIFFWEWFHRLWARLLGFVFLIPFIYFIVKRYFTKEMILPIFGMFVLGALQGAIGWIMVASGLVGDAIYVRPTKLAMHFVMAMVLACYVAWFAFKLLIDDKDRAQHQGLKWLMIVTLILLFVQFTYGALMAGHKAATVASTWPTINGTWVPENMNQSPSGHYLLENKLTIHFIHRNLAYLIFILISIYTFVGMRLSGSKKFKNWRIYPFVLGVIQVLLGIFTVLSSVTIHANQWKVFETIALAHQMVAMFLMLALLLQIFLLNKRSAH